MENQYSFRYKDIINIHTKLQKSILEKHIANEDFIEY